MRGSLGIVLYWFYVANVFRERRDVMFFFLGVRVVCMFFVFLFLFGVFLSFVVWNVVSFVFGLRVRG